MNDDQIKEPVLIGDALPCAPHEPVVHWRWPVTRQVLIS